MTYWDKHIEEYCKYFSNQWERTSRQFIRKVVSSGQFKDILEVGFGTADVPLYLEKEGITMPYTGLEVAKGFLDMAKVRYPQHIFVQGTVEKMPFADNSFDIVYGRHILEHLPYYEDGLAEMRRVARKKVIHVFFRLTSDEDDIAWKVAGYYNNYYGLPKLKKFLESEFSDCSYHFVLPGEKEKYLNMIAECTV